MALALLEQLALARPLDHPRAGFLLREAGEVACVLVHSSIRSDHHRLGKPVRPADREVGRIVARRHLQRARPELTLDERVRDDRHAPLDVRHDRFLADELAVALVLRMNRDRDVRQDRRRTDGCDRDAALTVRKRIRDVQQCVVDVDVVELEIRQRARVEWTPVDDAVVAVDPAAAVQVDEKAHHGARVLVVERESLAPVVE